MNMKFCAFACLFLLFSGCSASDAAMPTERNLLVLLDMSASTPLTDAQMLKRVYSSVAQEVRSVPVGSRIEVRTLGDDRVAVYSQTFHVKSWKTKEGDTAERLAQIVPESVVQFLRRAGTGPKQALQGESALTNGIYDASKICGADCRLLYFTDGFQNTENGVHYPRDSEKPLKPIPSLNLARMDVRMVGVGGGHETDPDTRIAIEMHWQTWLKAARARSIAIERF